MPRVRRLVARRPWVQWLVIGSIATATGASVADAIASLDAERDAWGRSVAVWVASDDVAVGDPIVAEAVSVPASIRPAGAIDDPDGAVARQAIGRGEIVTRLDAMAPDDELALAPPGWLVAPVRESPPSGARTGDRVHVVTDGFVLASDAVVVGFLDEVTLVAVPPDVAPLVPAATTPVTLLRSR